MPTKTLEWYPLYEGLYRPPLHADIETGYWEIEPFGPEYQVKYFKHNPDAMLYCEYGKYAALHQQFGADAQIAYTPFPLAFRTVCDTLEQAKQAAEDYFAKT